MKLGLINSAFAQAGRGTRFGLEQTRKIGFDTVDIFADPLDIDDAERRLIKNTAFLDFRLVAYPPDGGGVQSREQILGNYGGQLPNDIEIFSGPIRDSNGNIVAEQFYAVEKVSVITGRDLALQT